MVEDFLTWVWQPANALSLAQLAAAIVTAAATFALWRVTRILADETQVLAKMTSQPFVVCGLESSAVSASAFNLILRNTGNATAFDIDLEMNPSLPNLDGSTAAQDRLLKRVSMLPPNNALTLRAAMGRDIQPLTFDVNISWAHRPGSLSRENLAYSVNPRDGFQAGVVVKGTHHVAEELEKIRQVLKK